MTRFARYTSAIPSAMSATRLPTRAPLTTTPSGAGNGQTSDANARAPSVTTHAAVWRALAEGSTRSNVAVIVPRPPSWTFRRSGWLSSLGPTHAKAAARTGR